MAGYNAGFSERTHPLSSLAAMSLAAFGVTLASGLSALYLRSHRAVVFAFCSGALIGGAGFIILPDAVSLLEQSGRPLPAFTVWLAGGVGFAALFTLERRPHSDESKSTRLAGLGAAIGLAVHSFIDGVVIGQGFRAGEETGLAVAVAVMLHKTSDGASAVGVMLGTEHGFGQTLAMLVITAAAPVLGVIAQSFIVLPAFLLAFLLALFAGMLLFLGVSHLLPVAMRESTSDSTTSAVFLAGLGFVYLAHLLTH